MSDFILDVGQGDLISWASVSNTFSLTCILCAMVCSNTLIDLIHISSRSL